MRQRQQQQQQHTAGGKSFTDGVTSTCCTTSGDAFATAGSGGTTGSTSANNNSNKQLRRDLASQLDSRLCDIGGPISGEWEAIKRFAASEIETNLATSVRSDVESMLGHPQLQELVRRLRADRLEPDMQSEVLDQVTACLLHKVRDRHRHYLDRLNQQVSQMLVQLMRNDQLAAVIDDERLLNHLFRLAAASEEDSSQQT